MVKGPTSLELAFLGIWQSLAGPELVGQYRLPEWPKRLHRWDFAHPGSRVVIDLQGGITRGGWHQNIVRYDDDAEKLNLASLAGWRAFHLTRRMLERDPVGLVGPIVALAKGGEGERRG